MGTAENYIENTVKENETEIDTEEEISGQTENDFSCSSTDLVKGNVEYVEE